MFSYDLAKTPLIARVLLYLGFILLLETRLLLLEKTPSEIIK